MIERPPKPSLVTRVKVAPKPIPRAAYIFPIDLIPPLAPDDCALSNALRDAGLEMQWPISAPLSQPFGGGHVGIDVVALTGTPVKAAYAGKVTFAEFSHEGYGFLVTVQYPLMTVTTPVTTEVVVKAHYAHLSRVLVRKGMEVEAGQVLGEVGMTGHAYAPHLHFEVRLNGTPANPSCFLERREKPAQTQAADDETGLTPVPAVPAVDAAPTEIPSPTPEPTLAPTPEPTTALIAEPIPTAETLAAGD